MIKNRNFEFPIVAINKEGYGTIQNWTTTHKAFISNKSLYVFGAGICGNMILNLLE